MRPLPSIAALLLACIWAAQPANAQDSTGSLGSTAVEIVEPSMLENLRDLDFATVSVSAAGTATINPNTGAMTVTGGVAPAGGSPQAALFEISPPRRGSVFINLPDGPKLVTRTNGTETMAVTNWTISSNIASVGRGRYHLPAGTAPVQFWIGGTLNVQASQAQGAYVGTFEVTAEYP